MLDHTSCTHIVLNECFILNLKIVGARTIGLKVKPSKRDDKVYRIKILHMVVKYRDYYLLIKARHTMAETSFSITHFHFTFLAEHGN